jgi:hypothetical protein
MPSRSSSRAVRYSISPAFGNRHNSARAFRSNTTNGMRSRCSRWQAPARQDPPPQSRHPAHPAYQVTPRFPDPPAILPTQ